jgi:hypothetical protein
MIWGMTESTFTLAHVALSLLGIGSGVVVMFGLLTGKQLDGWTVLFLAATMATSVTGFGFPVDHLLPSHKVGIVSLVVLAVAIVARYALHLRGAWRRIYVVCAAVALYLNVFVGVVQAFQKVPALSVMAPNQNEPPFVITQLVVLGLFIVLAIAAVKGFRGESIHTVRT